VHKICSDIIQYTYDHNNRFLKSSLIFPSEVLKLLKVIIQLSINNHSKDLDI